MTAERGFTRAREGVIYCSIPMKTRAHASCMQDVFSSWQSKARVSHSQPVTAVPRFRVQVANVTFGDRPEYSSFILFAPHFFDYPPLGMQCRSHGCAIVAGQH